MNLQEINKIIVAIDDEIHDPTDCSLQDKFERRTKLMVEAGKLLTTVINEVLANKEIVNDVDF